MAFALRQKNIRRSLTCPICQKVFRHVTTVEECCHRFCQKCITKKITEEGLRNCPICDVDLGSAPLQKLSADYNWPRILDESNERKVEEKAERIKVSKQEMKRFDADIQTIAEPSTRTRSSYRNEKQKSVVVAVADAEKMRGPWRRSESEAKAAAMSYQFRESRARRRQREASEIQDDDSCYSYRNEEAFWFSLVASDNQKCKAPLKQIPARYLRVKDGNITVSSIKKYLMQKLNLHSENEVEISLEGRLLLPNLQICKVVDLWLRTAAPLEKKKAFVGSSAGDFVLPLTYAPRPIMPS